MLFDGLSEMRLSDVVAQTFAGAWGENPSDGMSENVYVIRATNIDSEGLINFARSAPRVFSRKELGCKRLKAGDLILEASGGGPGTPVGRVALFVGGPGKLPYACSNFFRVLRPNLDRVFPEYLAFLLDKIYRSTSIWRFQQQTTGIVNLRFSDYLEQRLMLPPLREQEEVVAAIHNVSSQQRVIEASVAKLDQLRKGVLDSMLSPAKAGEAVWPVRCLGNVAEVRGGLTLGGVTAGGRVAEVPYLRVANVRDGYISTGEIKTVRVTPSEVIRYRLQAGDVLITEGGDFDKLGRGGVWDGRIDPCLHQNHIFRVRCERNVLLPEFLALYLSSRGGKSYFLRVAKRTTNLASVSSSQVKVMPVPCPHVTEQKRMVDVLSVHDAAIAAEGRELTKLQSLKLGLIDSQVRGGDGALVSN